MHLMWDTADSTMEDAVLLVAPFQRLSVHVRYIPEDAAHKKVFFHKTDQPLHFPFGEGVTRFAQSRLKIQVVHESLVIPLPDGGAFHVPANDYAFHVVRKDMMGHAHIPEGMDHADEQAFLLSVREEFDVPYPAVMTHHFEAVGREHMPV